MNPTDFGGHRLKVKVMMGSIDKCGVRGDATLCVVIFYFQLFHDQNIYFQIMATTPFRSKGCPFIMPRVNRLGILFLSCLSVCCQLLNRKRQRIHIWHAYFTFNALSIDTNVNDLVTLTVIIMLKIAFSDFVFGGGMVLSN